MPSSGTGGPCDHCGRTQTCCWRRGPPSKPILCNACGSRYLVKRSLDGYKPLQVRQSANGGAPKGKQQHAAAAAAAAVLAAQEEKQKRAVLKRLDSDQLDSESIYSEESDYMTDDSAERSMEGVVERRRGGAGLLRGSKVMRITSASQLKELGGAELQSLAVSLLQSSLRTKPRKPLNPTITALF